MPRENERTLQDQIFELVQRSQETILDAGRTFAEGANDLTPGDLEHVDELIDNAFDLTERILKAQREFAKTVVRTVTPRIGGDDTESS